MIIHIDSNMFLENVVRILNHSGIHHDSMYIMGKETSGLEYSDELFSIKMSDDGLYGEIDRKYNNNPFFMKYNGTIIRFHGDYVYLEDHINNILRSI
jgi:hypothetical protein